ncbi:MAG: M12 family metallopeptidase [Pirellula sp.]
MSDTPHEEAKFCTELQHDNLSESLAAAVKENPDNIFTPTSGAGRSLLSEALMSMDAPLVAVLFQKTWKPGRTLRIAFLGDVNNTVRDGIISFAKQWLDHVNLRFDFVSGSSGDIRISTTPGGSWSYIGTDALTIPAAEPTMNYGWLTPSTPEKEYSRVVLHEFGHALGAIHEHQHPGVAIPWDRDAVYRYYARQGWSREQVDNNIFRRYESSQLNNSAYDRNSIMHYAIPNELTIGDFEVDWNTVLSPMDKSHFARIYPR